MTNRADVKDLWVHTSDDDAVHIHPDGQDCHVRHVVAYWYSLKGQHAIQFELPPDWDDTVAMFAVLAQVEQAIPLTI